MPVYLMLLFPNSPAGGGTLKKWLPKRKTELKAGDPLFSFERNGKEEQFPCPADGTLKVYLRHEGETLTAGEQVAVLSSSEQQALDLEIKGAGKILTPEEFKTTLEHADAASIRLPPDEL